MFMTSPHFEVPVPKSLLPKGGACLQAVSLSNCADWFVLTTEHAVERAVMQQTTLVSWTTTLRTLLEGLGDACVVALQWMRPAGDMRGWELAEVEEVWLAADDEAAQGGALVFKVSAVDWFLNEQGAPAAERVDGRRRLLSVQRHPVTGT
jgi:hypothetical protein